MILLCCDGNTATTSRHQRRQMCGGSNRRPPDQESGILPLSQLRLHNLCVNWCFVSFENKTLPI